MSAPLTAIVCYHWVPHNLLFKGHLIDVRQSVSWTIFFLQSPFSPCLHPTARLSNIHVDMRKMTPTTAAAPVGRHRTQVSSRCDPKYVTISTIVVADLYRLFLLLPSLLCSPCLSYSCHLWMILTSQVQFHGLCRHRHMFLLSVRRLALLLRISSHSLTSP